MIIFFLLIAILALIKIKPQRVFDDGNSYLKKDNTTSILGIFALIIFLSHMSSYLDTSSFNILDTTGSKILSLIGQLMVAPFLFFSGYGLIQQYKLRREDYTKHFLKNRVLKVYLMFIFAWILFAVVQLKISNEYSLSDYLLSLIAVRSIGNSNWYVFVIISLYLITYLSLLLFKKNDKLAIVSILVLSIGLYVGLYFSGWGSWWYNTIPSFVVGILFSFHKEKIEFLLNTRLKTIVCFIVSVLLFVGLYILNTKVGLSLIIYPFVNVFFCIGVLLFTRIFEIKNKILLFCGRNCFWIYILQRIPMIILRKVNFISNNNYVYLLSCLAVTFVLVFIFSKAFSFVWKLFFVKKGIASEESNMKIGVGISYVTLAVSIVAALIVTPKILSAVGDKYYGLYSFANSITSWLTVISTALACSYIKFASKEQKESGSLSKINSVYLRLFLIISAAVLGVTIIGCGCLYLFNFGLPQYTDEQNKLVILLLFISGIHVVITIMYSTFTHYCTYKKQFIFLRTLALLVSIGTYFLNIVFAVLTKSVIAISIIATAFSAVTCIATVIFAIRNQKMTFEKTSLKSDNKLVRNILIFSSFVLLNTIVDQINNNVDKTLLGSLVDAESVTYYSLAKYFNAYLLTLSTSISGVFAPKIHDLVQDNKKVELNALFLKVSKTQSLIIVCIIFGYIACGKYFVNLWLGPDYEFIYYYACVLLFIELIPLTVNFGIEVQRAMNKHKFRAVLYIILAILNIAISTVLIVLLPKEYAIWGAIIGTVFSVIVGNWTILNIYNHKKIGLPMGSYFAQIGKAALFGVVGAAGSLLVDYFLINGLNNNVIKFGITGFTFILIYFLLMILFEKKTLNSLLLYIKKK